MNNLQFQNDVNLLLAVLPDKIRSQINYSKMEDESQRTLKDINDIGVNEMDWYMDPNHNWNNNEKVLREHYFLVEFNEDGEVRRTNFSHIFSVREEDGVNIAKTVYSRNNKTGTYGNFR